MDRKKSLGIRLRELFSPGSRDEGFFEELEEILIEGDIGPIAAMEAVDVLREGIRRRGLRDRSALFDALKELLRSYLQIEGLEPEKGKLNLYLVLGVNGVGKTTTIAKLADYYRQNRGIERIILSAGDTFRAAAIDQLVLWGKHLDLPVIRQAPGADPGAVIFDSITSARAGGAELILADTAGRLHNKANLVRELAKIDKIIRNKISNGNYKKILIIDATTGQNALRQAEVFQESIGVDSIIMAKYDSTARGGIVLSICKNLGIPFSFLGTGEKLADLAFFDGETYLKNLIGGV